MLPLHGEELMMRRSLPRPISSTPHLPRCRPGGLPARARPAVEHPECLCHSVHNVHTNRPQCAHESTVDGFNFPLHVFIQAIEQPKIIFLSTPALQIHVPSPSQAREIFFGLRGLTKEVPSLCQKLCPKSL